MKRIISTLFLLIILLPLRVKALSVSKNNLTIEKGNQEIVDLYVEVDEDITEVNFTLVFTSYDAPAYFNVESGLTDNLNGIKHRIVFSEPVTGKIKLGTINVSIANNSQITSGTVNIHTGYALNTNGENIPLNSQIITANVQPTENTTNTNTDNTTNDNDTPVTNNEDNVSEEQTTNLLEKIESEIVNIELKDDVYEYKVYIADEVEELDLKPIAKDKSYKVEITTQKIKELVNGQIIITVKDGEYTEEYKITVKKISEQEKIEIDNSEFKPTYSYKGKWITLIIILSILLLVGLIFTKKLSK